MRAKHTPGPWKATENAYGCCFVQRWEAGSEHSLICGGNSHDTLRKADTHLIAAAPDLYDICDKMDRHGRDLPKAWREAIHAALAKARGEA